MGWIYIIKPLSTVLSSGIDNFEQNQENFSLVISRIEPRAAEWEASKLPLCYAASPTCPKSLAGLSVANGLRLWRVQAALLWQVGQRVDPAGIRSRVGAERLRGEEQGRPGEAEEEDQGAEGPEREGQEGVEREEGEQVPQESWKRRRENQMSCISMIFKFPKLDALSVLVHASY